MTVLAITTDLLQLVSLQEAYRRLDSTIRPDRGSERIACILLPARAVEVRTEKRIEARMDDVRCRSGRSSGAPSHRLS